MKSIKYIIALFIATAFIDCDDTFEDDFVKDSLPEIPVTFPGATTYGFNPYYDAAADGTVTITLQVPDNSRLEIKELTKVVAGGSGINAGTLADVKNANYLAGPVAVNGTSVSFTTSVTEFNSKVAAAARIPATFTEAFREGAFMILLTMEDDSKIVPMQVRFRVYK